MRIVMAMMLHETNTFSPVPTPLRRFASGRDRPLAGQAAIAAFRGTGMALGAFIDLAEAAGAEIVLAVAGAASPSGPVDQGAYEDMCGLICEAVARGCDGIMLHLHGAMVTEQLEDGEGALLARLRKLAPNTPIGVALDMHANVYPAMIENADAVAGYQTYPHVDIYETGLRAGRPIIEMVQSGMRPAMAAGTLPLLAHVMRQASGDSPNREIQALCRRFEAEGALSASYFVGFPNADIRLAGASAVVVTRGDAAAAQAMRDEILDLAWRSRHDFLYQIEPLAEAIGRAQRLTEGPIVLLDHCDNAASGGTMDTMRVIEAILEAGLEDVIIFGVCDPDAVQRMVTAGVGQTLTLDLGGRSAMPSIGLAGRPISVTGRVRLISDGCYVNEGPMMRGATGYMGPTAVLDTGWVKIVVMSDQTEPFDMACFTSLGLDPRRSRYTMLKSKVHWRAGLGNFAKAVIDCAGEGVCTNEYAKLPFKNLRRPIFPIDMDMTRDPV